MQVPSLFTAYIFMEFLKFQEDKPIIFDDTTSVIKDGIKRYRIDRL